MIENCNSMRDQTEPEVQTKEEGTKTKKRSQNDHIIQCWQTRPSQKNGTKKRIAYKNQSQIFILIRARDGL
jgi:uncharacterized protein YxeA